MSWVRVLEARCIFKQDLYFAWLEYSATCLLLLRTGFSFRDLVVVSDRIMLFRKIERKRNVPYRKTKMSLISYMRWKLRPSCIRHRLMLSYINTVCTSVLIRGLGLHICETHKHRCNDRITTHSDPNERFLKIFFQPLETWSCFSSLR